MHSTLSLEPGWRLSSHSAHRSLTFRDRNCFRFRYSHPPQPVRFRTHTPGCFTLFFWAGGTWWIPLLFILGFWRHVYKRFPLAYDPQYWGMVFPLGMYTACTFQLSKAIHFEPLMLIPRVFIYFALAAWLAASVGLIYSLLFKQNRN